MRRVKYVYKLDTPFEVGPVRLTTLSQAPLRHKSPQAGVRRLPVFPADGTPAADLGHRGPRIQCLRSRATTLWQFASISSCNGRSGYDQGFNWLNAMWNVQKLRVQWPALQSVWTITTRRSSRSARPVRSRTSRSSYSSRPIPARTHASSRHFQVWGRLGSECSAREVVKNIEAWQGVDPDEVRLPG